MENKETESAWESVLLPSVAVDLNDPEFSKAQKVHDWRNHVPGDIRTVWHLLTSREK